MSNLLRLRSVGALALLVFLAALEGCAPAGGGPGWQDRGRPWFDAEVLTGMGESGQPIATLSVSIPYRNLVFFRVDDAFVARYRVRALQRIDGVAQSVGEWSGEVHASTYDETRRSLVTRKTLTLDLATVNSTPEGIALDVQVQVLRTQRVGSVRLAIQPRQFREGGITLGELAFYRRRDLSAEIPAPIEVMGHAVPDPELFRRQNSATFDLATGEPWLLLRIFDLRAEAERNDHEVTVRVFRGETDREVWSHDFVAVSQGVETSALLLLPPEAFAFGANSVRVSRPGAESSEGQVQNQGLDLSDAQSWEANLRQVLVLADSAERDALEDAPASERQDRWREFWNRRDPDPGTPENERLETHFQRVAYARSFLQDGMRDGALSDRGQIHILHGKPDHIEGSAPGLDSFTSYEVWRYTQLGLAYYFQDSDGLGQYRLVWRENI